MIKTLQALVDSVYKAHLDSSNKDLKKATFRNFRKGGVDVEIMSFSQNDDIVIYQWVDEVKVYRCVFTGPAEEAKEFIANKEW